MPIHRIIIREYRDHEFYLDAPSLALLEWRAMEAARASSTTPGAKFTVLRGPEPPRRRRSDPKESAQP